jgi:CDP-6-deoxy-D-xylo-4-hexulose-3-dehydrase
MSKRDEILKLVREYYQEELAGKSFSPQRDIVHYAGRVFDEQELVNLVNSSLDFNLTAGRYALRFEAAFAKYMGVSDAILVNSGSSANLVALTTLTSPSLGDRRLKPGDEVITVAAGFPTTVALIIQNQLVPVFVDVSIGDYTAIPGQLEQAISEKTRAIFMAHTLGVPFDLDVVMDLAHRYNLWVIEDNCDALGSRYRGQLTGTFGHLATVSFYPAHHITMGEGGCVVTNDPDLARIARSIRDWGRDCYCPGGKNNTCGKRFEQQFGTLPFGYDHKYVYSHIGYNLKVTDMQAAIGLAQLDKLPAFIDSRKKNHQYIEDILKKYEDRLVLHHALPNSDTSCFCYVISVREDAGFTRNEFTHFLETNKIETATFFLAI